MHIKHVTLRVANMEESIRFYESMTELTVARRFTEGTAEVAFLTHGEGETEIELLHIPGGQTFEGKGMFICFETDRIDPMHQLALDQDLNPSPIQMPADGTRYFYVYDPNGVSIQLRQFRD